MLLFNFIIGINFIFFVLEYDNDYGLELITRSKQLPQ